MERQVPGGLLLYRQSLRQDASTIMEHVNSFAEYSAFKFWTLNVELGFPKNLISLKFDSLVLHYSLFGSHPFGLNKDWLNYIKSLPNTIKISFFQDEMQYCKFRFDLINELELDIIFSLLDPEHFQVVYGDHTNTRCILHTLTGYVDDTLIANANSLTKADQDRTIDVGYRGRPLPYYMGKGAREKVVIADEFVQRIKSKDLNIDIQTDEESRIYGDNWYKFVSECRTMIGVESGVSIFDLDGQIKLRTEKYLLMNANATFEETYEAVLKPFEGRIDYRTISPRIFECAALKVCMVLFEGKYNDILIPYEHYIPLKKDFSNFNEVLAAFTNPDERRRLTENAFRDLIDSKKYSYHSFVENFDAELKSRGLNPPISDVEIKRISRALMSDEWFRKTKVKSRIAASNLLNLFRK